MKAMIYLLRGLLLMLCLITTVSVYPQEAKEQKKNAATKQNANRPNAAKKKNVAAKKKGVAAKKKPAPKKPASYIALKTNVPFLAVSVLNLTVEAQITEHISIDLPVMWSIGDLERKHALRTIALQPEGRWWLKSVGTGHFFGLHAHIAWFNLKWDNDRYQSEKHPLMGAGISYGYKMPITRHLGAEFTVGAGYANMQYNTYYNIENGAQIDSRLRHYWGITRVGASLVYRF